MRYTRIVPLLAILLIAAGLLSGCSRQEIYEAAMRYERSSAGLVPDTISVDGRTIAYLHNEDMHDGDTIVMLHGFAADKENWLRMAAELTDQYNVYAIDLPGHGASNKDLDRAYGISDQVGYVKDILDALQLSQVHMVGNSMGGAITALYAATYPDRIKTATLLDPAGIFEYDSELVGLVLKGENPLVVSKPGDFEKLVDFALEKKPFVPWPIYSVMEQKAIANHAINQHIFLEIRDSGYQPEFRDSIENIRAPVLIVWGKQDRVINYRNADVFSARIPHSQKVILDGVGHAPMIEVPEQTATMLRRFIEQPDTIITADAD
ncbi:MAG: alpha/beta hydrolase [Alteromonadaceae bacterium]|nr:alpha/beta hydrolase [Alteromonadaceae bacterium]MBH87011.1 alpha/beta hydrolase [Alteromonadaceae bacterium]|tara:strand:- start:7059 stop:8021 length:963 start_codon:yes stop_codon:yes gene_type:complete